MKNVSCEYERWVVETQLCKLRDTLDKTIGRAFAMFHLQYNIYGICELHLRYMSYFLLFSYSETGKKNVGRTID